MSTCSVSKVRGGGAFRPPLRARWVVAAAAAAEACSCPAPGRRRPPTAACGAGGPGALAAAARLPRQDGVSVPPWRSLAGPVRRAAGRVRGELARSVALFPGRVLRLLLFPCSSATVLLVPCAQAPSCLFCCLYPSRAVPSLGGFSSVP